jgi:hypothetical protein
MRMPTAADEILGQSLIITDWRAVVLSLKNEKPLSVKVRLYEMSRNVKLFIPEIRRIAVSSTALWQPLSCKS